ncbi:hypothetical protein AOQ84DRAFT_223642 [Glonium stellatum]|uniref:Uncharacterized protein n=1 Tax=Glonium stellatum TaxID=574774 RepID=A0A8E2EXA6_9PEZI|nr:hypothetical protein AOQ84DRAFT_223642 [Glonium stellatum]
MTYTMTQNGSVMSSTDYTLFEEGRDHIMQWAADSQLESSETGVDFLDDSSNIRVANNSNSGPLSGTSSSVVASSPGDDFVLPALDFNLEELLRSPSPPPPLPPLAPIQQTESTTPTAQTEAQSGRQQQNGISSQCVVDCCQIINDLENYILAELKVFKLVLGIVKKALEKLIQLIAIQQGSRNLRCLMLFNTIMYQIIELLESCHAALSEESERQRGRGSIGQSPSVLSSGLGYSDFCMDAEEQSAWRSRVMLKEMNQASEVVQKIKTLAGVGPDPSGTSTPLVGKAREFREHCYIDLELRLKDLATRITRQR